MKHTITSALSTAFILSIALGLARGGGCGLKCKSTDDCEGQLICTKSSVCYDDPAIGTTICKGEGWKAEKDPKTGFSVYCNGWGICYPYYDLYPVYQPVLPVQPVQPVVPVQPVQPVVPVQPVQPVQPVVPVQPVQPVQPVVPVQPVQPVVPVQPVQPVQPVPGK